MGVNSSSLASIVTIESGDADTNEGSFSEKRLGGPKTAAGKRRSSRNGLKAGLYASATLVGSESESEFLDFARAIVAGLDVRSAVEMAIAERLVSALWRARRARRFETAHLELEAQEVARLREALDEAEAKLLDCQKEREGVLVLCYPTPTTRDRVEDAKNGVLRIAEQHLPDSWRNLDDILGFADRNRVSKARVNKLADAAREALLPILKGTPDTHAVMLWLFEELSNIEGELVAARDSAAAAHAKAVPAALLLPMDGTALQVGRMSIHRGVPGKTLDDAERRLDRQVTRAISDLEAARRLRP